MRDNLDPEEVLLKNGLHSSSNTAHKFTIQPAMSSCVYYIVCVL